MSVVNLIECIKTWQGEGVEPGIGMLLCRFKYCNRKCPFCDTQVKMRISQQATYYLEEIQRQIDKHNLGLMITGGEPTFYVHFDETLLLLNQLSYPVAHVESNGYNLLELISQTDMSKNVKFMYSPKIFSKEDLEQEINRSSDLLQIDSVFFKIVYQEYELLLQYLDWLATKVSKKQFNKVWLMPEGVTRTDLIQKSSAVFDACEKYNFNFSSRMHIIFGFV